MRLWSLHPKYLDSRGLVALWREALLAQAVLRGNTRGYRRHPQLARFRATPAPLAAIAAYLDAVQREASARGYRFERSKIVGEPSAAPIEVTSGQVAYEWQHLLTKLAERDPARFEAQREIAVPACHPLFTVRAGPAEAWERLVGGPQHTVVNGRTQ